MSIESRFDIRFVSALALREKQIQQNYRPIIAVHKWFARRPGTLFRALILSEFGSAPLSEIYFKANDFHGLNIADPFMGGGTTLIEANRVGCDVTGIDINPIATWIVRESIKHIDLGEYQRESEALVRKLRNHVGELYLTNCPLYGDQGVPVKYFLWVKVLPCESCGHSIDLFPGYVISEDSRHPKNVLVCPLCGELNEVAERANPGPCCSCQAPLRVGGPARRNCCACPVCGHANRYPRAAKGPLRHRLFAIEYYNPKRKSVHKGRFFKKPDTDDLMRVAAAREQWTRMKGRFVPDQAILRGDETRRLHRWGYTHYRQMFSERQLLGLELSCEYIESVKDERVRHALATNLSDLLRYQNMLCRYDTWALKSLDIFSVHGFPIGLVQCESNLPGIVNGSAINVGSGGWSNMIEKYIRAKRFCSAPFEVLQTGARKLQVPIHGEWIGERMDGLRPRHVAIRCANATEITLPPQSQDAVFTDPPYFGNVQYGELMDFCYVWLRKLVGDDAEGFDPLSTHVAEELTGNVTHSRGLEHFTEGLARAYTRMAEALKPGAPLAFTFHHNKLEAYCAVGVAILDAGLTCSASFPCPAEMGGSIHIHGTASSIVDTVFVCRNAGTMRRQWLFTSAPELASIVGRDLAELAESGLKPTRGDIRCIVLGHLARMAVWNLRKGWNCGAPTIAKLKLLQEAVASLADPETLVDFLSGSAKRSLAPASPLFGAVDV